MTDSSSPPSPQSFALPPMPPVTVRSFRHLLPTSSAVIRPGSSEWVSARPSSAFRADRIIVSPSSFPLSLFRRFWTLPVVLLGRLLLLIHRLLAFALRVDLFAPHHRREYVGEGAGVSSSDAGLAGDDDGLMYDEEEDRYYVTVKISLNLRERILAPLARLSRALLGIRSSWQYAQLAFVSLTDVIISGRSQFAHGSSLPCDMLSPMSTSLSIPMSFASCSGGQEIKLRFYNGGRVECRLAMFILGTLMAEGSPRESLHPTPC